MEVKVPKQLTVKMLERSRPRGDRETWLHDTTRGLLFCVRPSGQKAWYFKTIYPQHSGQTRRLLGLYRDEQSKQPGGLSLAEARAKASDWYTWVKQGLDPAAVEAEQQARAKDRERKAQALADSRTFGAFAEKYISERRNRRAVVDAREIRRMLIAAWADRPLHDITPRDVRELITRLRLRAPYDARNCWSHMTAIFKSAVHEELVAVSPCASVDKKLLFANAGIGPRQRVLNEMELAVFWRAAGRLGWPYGPYFRLLLLL